MSCDNDRAEGFFGLLKQEFLYSRDREGVGVAGFMAELDAWMCWFRSGAYPRRSAGSRPTSTDSR